MVRYTQREYREFWVALTRAKFDSTGHYRAITRGMPGQAWRREQSGNAQLPYEALRSRQQWALSRVDYTRIREDELNCGCPIQPADDGSGVHPLHRENVWRSSVGPVLGQRDCLIVVKSRLLAKTLTCRVHALVASVQKWVGIPQTTNSQRECPLHRRIGTQHCPTTERQTLMHRIPPRDGATEKNGHKR